MQISSTVNTPLILASESERRRKILLEMGLTFETVVPQVEEVHVEDQPIFSVRENARRKHAWCRECRPDGVIIAADTVVDFRGRCVPKPRSMDEARDFLRMFSGHSQQVHTGVALSRPGRQVDVKVVTSDVSFKELSDVAIDAYLRRVDPMDKAGAYDIDQQGDLIIASYSGSRTNIMGLPRETVAEWLENCAG